MNASNVACALVALALATLAPSLVAHARSRIPGCAGAAATTIPLHPLACRAFGASGREITADSLARRIAGAPLALLGEVHDNAQHHAIRAALILHVAALQRASGAGPTALVFEHIRADQQLALAGFRALDKRQRQPAERLLAALAWERSGWPPAAIFQPLFEAALDLEWPILPGDPARDDVRTVAKGGIAVLDQAERRRLQLDTGLPPAIQAALLAELEASHCGLMPKTAFTNLAEAQRFRDAHLARALADAAEQHGHAILIAGNGHVRADRGVPFHLRDMGHGKTVVSVLIEEVEAGKITPGAYIRPAPGTAPTADVVILTPRIERPDPCVEMKKRFRPPQ